jgi:hypothetical protein
MSRLHIETFLDAAAQHFSKNAGGGSPSLETATPFLGFVLLLATRAPEQLAPLIDRTSELDGAAGRELRTAVLDVLSDPRSCDMLGWLETGRLIGELERC